MLCAENHLMHGTVSVFIVILHGAVAMATNSIKIVLMTLKSPSNVIEKAGILLQCARDKKMDWLTYNLTVMMKSNPWSSLINVDHFHGIQNKKRSSYLLD